MSLDEGLSVILSLCFVALIIGGIFSLGERNVHVDNVVLDREKGHCTEVIPATEVGKQAECKTWTKK